MESKTNRGTANTQYYIAQSTGERNYTGGELTQIDLNTIGLYIGLGSGLLGIVAGIITVLKVYRDVVRLFNEFSTRDKLHEARMDNLNNKIERVDGDLRDLHRDMVSQHNSVRQEIALAMTTVRNSSENWDKYVEKGIITPEQLKEIRLEKSKDDIQ